ncbi:P1 family peptidase [Peptoniphilus sp. MSJ-1]|uniref:P1 family peptidase n=1 Tax=Peptoniphilus ovalis TaxID=2841503 RepID=A0ABS6FGX7_9FIRM|nr:P1 family peptidase [Peptoniphilus ovalis]MBU5669229.1 P1 family peptidase [Peptoniphilus ovalis]
MYQGFLTDVGGVKLGHSQDLEALTGVSVVLCEEGFTAGVDVRGAGPGTRETDLLRAENLVQKIHGLFLTGGSAYGLDVGGGIMKYLEEKGHGFDVGVGLVPIVPGAVLFDLAVGDSKIRPDFKMGYKACQNAKEKDETMGNYGAGTGASVGKILGNDYAMKTGIGQSSLKVGDLVVSSIVALNALGDIYDYEKGERIAGVYDRENKKFLNTNELYENKFKGYNQSVSLANTTISVIATNAKLSKANCNKISQMAHDGYARSINPVHTMNDGDTIFTIASGEVESDINLIGILAAKSISRSIANAVYSSCDCGGLVSYNSI